MPLMMKMVNGRKGALRAELFQSRSRNKRECAPLGRIGGNMSNVWCARCVANVQDTEVLAYPP